MNICIISQEYPPETNLGGIATYSQTLARQLAKNGHDVSVVTYTYGDEHAYDDCGVHVHRVSWRSRRSLTEDQSRELAATIPKDHNLLNFSRRVYEKIHDLHDACPFDVIEAPDTCAQALVTFLLLKGPVKITRLHTPFFLIRRFNKTEDTEENLFRDELEKLQYLLSDHVTSPTRVLAEIIKKNWGDKAIAIIPNFFSLSDCEVDCSVYESHLFGQEYVLYFGRLQYLKGVHVLAKALVEVMSRNDKIKAVIIGNDSIYDKTSSKESMLQTLAAFKDRLVFMDNMPHKHLYPIVSKAKFVVLPSLWENFPYACLETMALGKAVVGTKGCGFSEIIDDGVDGFLCNSGDPAALSEVILDCLTRDDLDAIGEKAAAKAATFDNFGTVTRMAQFYRSCLKKTGMTILYPTSMFPKLSETFILEQITGLIDLGHDVKIVAFYHPDEKIFHPQIEKYDLLAKTRYISKLEGDQWLKDVEIMDFLADVDVVHAHFAALPTDFALRAYNVLGIPFVFTTHAYDIFVHTSPHQLSLYAASAQRIITVSEFNKEYMLEMIGEQFRDKIEIVRCGIDVRRFSPIPRVAKKRVTILATGRFVEKKGLRYALEAVARLPERLDVMLRVVGDGPLRESLERLIEELNLVHRVTLLGALPQSEVIREMNDADIFMLPSVTAANNDREGLPVSILEAQAMKLPVVSTLHTGIPEGVIDCETGLLAAEQDVAALAGHLATLIEAPELRERMGQKGRDHVEMKFNIDVELEKLEKHLVAAASPTVSRTGSKAAKKIRVLFVSHSAYFFGAEQSFLFLLRNLDRSVIEPVVTLPEDLNDGALAKEITTLGIPLYIVDFPRRWIDFPVNGEALDGLLEEFAAVDAYKELIEQQHIDLVYTNTITKLAAAVAAKLTGTPHVYHVREVLEDHPLRGFFSRDATFRILDLLSDHIITNSSYVINQFGCIAGHKEITPVYNALDASRFERAAATGRLRRELGIDEETALVAIIGSVHRHKNHKDVIAALGLLAARGTRAILAVIGHPFQDYLEELIQQVKRLGIEDRVFFLPFRSDIEELLPEIDLLVIASLAEPFGRTTIEAMAAGKPVVATSTGASPEIVVDGVTGFLVPVRNPEAMADAIGNLIADPQLRSRMGLAGRIRVKRVFNKTNYVLPITEIMVKTVEASTSVPVSIAAIAADITSVISRNELEALRHEVGKAIAASAFSNTATSGYKFATEILRTNEVSMSTKEPETPSPNRARLISFYLPQFHPIPENDAWWGKGFTEWTNVSKTKPLFPGHHQPHLPSDLGFYDLRLPDARNAQAEMARDHGIEAFCYWHYWFHGKRLIDRPFAEVLNSKEPDFSFCLAWANETWSRRWLGEEKDILMAQTYSPEDDLNHARWLLQVFADPRCVKVNGRPMFLIYRPTDLPDPQRTTDLIRNESVRNGLPDPFLIGINSHCWNLDCRTIGFDRTLLFLPQLGNLPEFMNDDPSESKRERNKRLGVDSDRYKLYDYEESLVSMLGNRSKYSHPVMPSIFVGWDNTPRRSENGIVLLDSRPEIFGKHLEKLVEEVQTNPIEERFVFINAWNEWAEGNHLEPDNKHGRSFLEEVRRINGPVVTSPKAAEAKFAEPERDAATIGNQLAKAIAFFLPQYHPIPENDTWWGKGFTEWSNVTKAQPQFPGHFQPHLPSDLGYYDLRLPQVRKAQADLAREYGIHGFCYYHYWFGGEVLLEQPLHDMLNSKEPDFPFCLCWANEEWTRAWDGRSGQVLKAQRYGEDDYRSQVRYLSQFFQDRRYIRVNGKPLFLIYRANHMPDPRGAVETIREEARRIGVGELYLCRVESFSNEHNDPGAIGFDAAVEFQPDWSRIGKKKTSPVFGDHAVHDYQEMVARMMAKKRPPYKRFPCVTPMWDNTSRRKSNATVFINSSPRLYGRWLNHAARRCGVDNPDDRIVFINAWNEWGEGCHLEPDQVNGRGYLEETRKALDAASCESAVLLAEPPTSKEADDTRILELGRAIAEYEQKLAEKDAAVAERERIIKEHEALIAERERRIADLLNSASWKITGPLRWGYEKISGNGS